MMDSDVAVVGAGPAGIAAARAAAEAGAAVTVIDEYGGAGGQYFKRASGSFSLDRSLLSREHDPGEAERATLEHEGIRYLPNALVWGVFDDRDVMLYHDGRCEALRAKAVVLATGAYDRPVAFPGWTLPGVMTAGGAQTLAKTQWVMPGRRVLLAGAGPFLLPVAQQLARSGAELVAILEATGPTQWWRHARALWGQWPRFAEAWDYMRTVLGKRVPIRFKHKIVAALGDGAVEAALISKVDGSWRARPGTEQRLRVDAIAVGYGFLPSLDLAACCGCALRWDEHGLSWFVDCTPTMATDRPGIFAAGEITGIAGAAPAMEEGRIAGISAAEHAGCLTAADADARRREPMARRAKLEGFASMINRLFGPRAGLWEGMTDPTTVCRCEEVTAGEVRNAVCTGCASPKEVKDLTRAGMGLCQGRICRPLVTRLIAESADMDARNVPLPRIRPPVKPVPLGALAETELPVG